MGDLCGHQQLRLGGRLDCCRYAGVALQQALSASRFIKEKTQMICGRNLNQVRASPQRRSTLGNRRAVDGFELTEAMLYRGSKVRQSQGGIKTAVLCAQTEEVERLRKALAG